MCHLITDLSEEGQVSCVSSNGRKRGHTHRVRLTRAPMRRFWACLEHFGGPADSLEGMLGLWMAAFVRVNEQTEPHVAPLHICTLCVQLQSHDCI